MQRIIGMKSELDKYVIARVREKRLEQGVSQRAIAFTIGRSASFVGQVESDRFTTKYTVHQLYLIAKDLGCSPAEFFPPLDDPRFESEE